MDSTAQPTPSELFFDIGEYKFTVSGGNSPGGPFGVTCYNSADPLIRFSKKDCEFKPLVGNVMEKLQSMLALPVTKITCEVSDNVMSFRIEVPLFDIVIKEDLPKEQLPRMELELEMLKKDFLKLRDSIKEQDRKKKLLIHLSVEDSNIIFSLSENHTEEEQKHLARIKADIFAKAHKVFHEEVRKSSKLTVELVEKLNKAKSDEEWCATALKGIGLSFRCDYGRLSRFLEDYYVVSGCQLMKPAHFKFESAHLELTIRERASGDDNLKTISELRFDGNDIPFRIIGVNKNESHDKQIDSSNFRPYTFLCMK